jgi:LuxR family maltose regulon positive regulatory protein
VPLEGESGKAMDSLVALAVNGAARISNELFLIIDDYHHVEDPWAHKLMQKLLDHCPDNLTSSSRRALHRRSASVACACSSG